MSTKIEEAIINITLIFDNKLKIITDQHNETIIKLNLIIANQNTIIEKLEEKYNINDIKTYASITSENITTILNKVDDSIKESFVQSAKKMEINKNNSIILYNVNESEDKSYMSRKQHDASEIKSFVSLINKDNIDISCIDHFRLCKYEKNVKNDISPVIKRQRPLKVIFKSYTDQISIFNQLFNLKNTNNKIIVSKDYSFDQLKIKRDTITGESKLSEEGYKFIVKDIANSFKILKIKQNNNE